MRVKSMRRSWVVLTLLAGVVPALLCGSAPARDPGPEAQTAPRNLCPNPGFERLNPAGDNFPIGWAGPVNTFIDKDAHSGSIAIRLSCKGRRAGMAKLGRHSPCGAGF